MDVNLNRWLHWNARIDPDVKAIDVLLMFEPLDQGLGREPVWIPKDETHLMPDLGVAIAQPQKADAAQRHRKRACLELKFGFGWLVAAKEYFSRRRLHCGRHGVRWFVRRQQAVRCP